MKKINSKNIFIAALLAGALLLYLLSVEEEALEQAEAQFGNEFLLLANSDFLNAEIAIL